VQNSEKDVEKYQTDIAEQKKKIQDNEQEKKDKEERK
jgi:hypothetical protein